MICKTLRLFRNTLTADDKYSLINRDILMQPIQMHLSQKQETFSDFSPVFSKSILFFEYIFKKMTLTAHIFWKLRISKNVVR